MYQVYLNGQKTKVDHTDRHYALTVFERASRQGKAFFLDTVGIERYYLENYDAPVRNDVTLRQYKLMCKEV